jgi:hypothetical protein
MVASTVADEAARALADACCRCRALLRVLQLQLQAAAGAAAEAVAACVIVDILHAVQPLCVETPSLAE